MRNSQAKVLDNSEKVLKIAFALGLFSHSERTAAKLTCSFSGLIDPGWSSDSDEGGYSASS